ncbi:MAG: hypothetical protein JWQ42_4486 [Edaphobacter sp.]|nr:hypothetical protein [Edaphobacter sp.]
MKIVDKEVHNSPRHVHSYHAKTPRLDARIHENPSKNINPPCRKICAKILQNIPRKILILHNRSHLLPHILRIHHNHLLNPRSRLPLNHRQGG